MRSAGKPWNLFPILAVLAACGGGGGGGGGSPPPPATYTIGGTVSGLAGSGLVLQNNGANDLSISANGSFTFTTAVAPGGGYSVTVAANPSTPTQTCIVTAGSGSVGSANVSSVAVACTTSSFVVGGSVTGLTGSGLQIRSADGTTLTVGNGPFSFPTPALSGSAYHAAIVTQPSSPTQYCTASGAHGVVGASDVSMSITCNSGTARYLYVTDLFHNTVYGLAVDATTGALAPIMGSPFDTGQGAQPSVITPSGSFVYVLNEGDGTITGFAAHAATGALTQIGGSPFSVTGTGFSTLPTMVMDPSGRFLYVLVEGTGSIAGFAIDPTTGALTRVMGADFAAPGVGWAGFDPLDRFLYYTGTTPSGTYVATARIDAQTGALVQAGTQTFISGTLPVNPPQAAVKPSGNFVYVMIGDLVYPVSLDPATGQPSQSDASVSVTGANHLKFDPSGRFLYVDSINFALAGFSIDATTGGLTPLPGSPYASGAKDTHDFDLDPQGHFLYLPVLDNWLNAYAIDGTAGALAPLGASPYTVDAAPAQVRVDLSGRFLYLASSGTSTVSSFSLDPVTGAVTLIGSVPVGAPTSIAASNFTLAGTQ